MRRFCVLAVSFALVVTAIPAPIAAAPRAKQQQQIQTQGGTVHGVAKDAQQQPLSHVVVRLRNVQTGEIAATGTTGESGDFTFTGIPAGTYIVEVLDSRGGIIAATAPFGVTAGSTETVMVTASAAANTAAAAGGGLFGMGAAGTVMLVAGAAAAIGITVGVTQGTRSEKSTSR